MLPLFCVALALCACKQRFTNENLAVVDNEMKRAEAKGPREGVSPKELESILGQPAEVRIHKLPLETQKKEVEVVQYYYRQDGQELEFHFFDSKLISKVPRLPDPLATPEAKP